VQPDQTLESLTRKLALLFESQRKPLDGSKSECSTYRYASDPDLSDKRSGKFQGGKLTLKIRSIHDANGNPIEMVYRVEEWELSKDSKTLTIHVPELCLHRNCLPGGAGPAEFNRIDGP
jgi:hypothetical protein